MPYGLIILTASIGLVAAYVLVTEVAYWLKGLVVGLLVVSFLWRYGLFLQLVLGVSISLYFTCLKARCE
jgi:hypothetical protein